MIVENEIVSTKLTFEGKFTKMEIERIEKYINILKCDNVLDLKNTLNTYSDNREFNFAIINLNTLICKRLDKKKV